MGYQRGMSTQPDSTVRTVEQARRLNAALRLELEALTAENAHLAPKVEAMRRDVTTARKKLTQQIRGLDAIRTQAANIAALAAQARGEEPVYGGPEGLQAAADEIKAHEDKHLNLSNPKRRRGRGHSHGTRGMYETGCDCDPCLGWRIRKTARGRELRQSQRAA